MPSNCRLRGEAEANTTRLLRRKFSGSMSSGSSGGGPGLLGDRAASGGAAPLTLMGAGMFFDSSYEGGGPEGVVMVGQWQ